MQSNTGDLKDYRRKRRFDRTVEPEGKVSRSGSGRLFVVQKHAASRLHYDFRLELDGVLKSWAVPKGPSLDPSEKRLAVHVEDHPVDYGDFEGIIPPGEYGGGTVMLWDRGEWEPQDDPRKGYAAGRLKFRLKGGKLKGLWMLAQMAEKDSGEDKNWFLFKLKDKFADGKGDILTAAPLSVATERSMEEIAAAGDRVWSVRSEIAPEAAAKDGADPAAAAAQDLATITGIRRSAFPGVIKPQLATLVETPPQGDLWLHEIKYDGYRILAYKKDSRVRLLTRNAKDWTARMSYPVNSLEALAIEEFVLDGEMVVRRDDGTTDFQSLQNVLKGSAAGRLVYYVFDILYLEGYDLMRTPLSERKNILKRLLTGQAKDSPVQFSDHILGGGPAVYQHACRYALEGVVSKRVDAAYRLRRTSNWVKSKCLQRQEFAIGGFTSPSGSRIGFGALLLGVHTPSGDLMYAGRVGTGFDQEMLQMLTRDLESIEQTVSPFATPLSGSEVRDVRWVRPERVAEVEFSQWTADGRLRHPAFKGLRKDKAAGEIVRETPVALPHKPNPKETNLSSSSAGMKSVTASPAGRVAGIHLSHPDRVMYPDQGITKYELALYYEQAAERILPHISRRPLTIVRCPQGRQKKCFYQKHFTDQLPASVKGISIKEKTETRLYIIIEDIRGIIALIQLGALEFHPWGSRADRLEYPDQMTFDMDPGPGIPLCQLVDGCRLLRNRLQDLGLESFVKTSGGKGFHIVVPLVRRSDWEEVKAFSAAVSIDLTRRYPNLFIATMSKAMRNNKIFVDYLRNARGATSVAPYSSRARSGAPVSVPLSWQELSEQVKPDAYTVENLEHRWTVVEKDPWSNFFKIRQSITVAMKNTLQLKR
ncbi:MAG: DNA ligase D [Desulfobacterales bacterium]